VDGEAVCVGVHVVVCVRFGGFWDSSGEGWGVGLMDVGGGRGSGKDGRP